MMDCLLIFTADKNLNSHGTDIQTDGFFDINSNIFIGQFFENAGTSGNPAAQWIEKWKAG